MIVLLSSFSTVLVPLDSVKEDWLEEIGPYHLRAVAEHYGIYGDLFNDAYFLPVLPVNIHFDYDEEYVTPVYCGNQISPEEVCYRFSLVHGHAVICMISLHCSKSW